MGLIAEWDDRGKRELEDRSREIIQSENQPKKLFKNGQKLRAGENIIHQTHA